MIIRIDYSEPSVRLDLWGGTSGTFNGMDQFNRIIDQRWQAYGGSSTVLDEYQYGYDQDSNRVWKANATATGLDEFYSYDPLNRLTAMQRGTLNSTKTGITGTPGREMDYGLDPTGNWSSYQTKTSGTTDLSQTRTSNKVNEITAFSSTPSWSTPPTYDAAGNMTGFPQPNSPGNSFTAVYDAWNRMVSVSDGTNTVGQYQYDGLNWRIVKKTYTGGTLSQTRHFYYTSNWQDIEERVGTSTTADVQYIWGIRYVDELICRDDTTPRRLYAFQDANFNVTGLCNASGSVVERYVFDPYGQRAIYDASWSPRSTSGYAWVMGHQGLMLDVDTELIYNRNRYLNPQLGRYLQRDLLEYEDDVNLYELLHDSPLNYVDPSGKSAVWTIIGWVGAGLVEIAGAGPEDPAADAAATGILYWTGAIGEAAETVGAAGNLLPGDKCSNGKCKPCVPPVGTKMAREDLIGEAHYDKLTKQYIQTPHSHIYIVNQTSYPACACELNKLSDKKGGIEGGVGIYPLAVQPTGGGPAD